MKKKSKFRIVEAAAAQIEYFVEAESAIEAVTEVLCGRAEGRYLSPTASVEPDMDRWIPLEDMPKLTARDRVNLLGSGETRFDEYIPSIIDVRKARKEKK